MFHNFKTILLAAIISQSVSSEVNFETIDRLIIENSHQEYGLADTNSNRGYFEKLRLCKLISVQELTIRNRHSFLDIKCDGKKTRATLAIGKRIDVLFSKLNIKKGTEISPRNAIIKTIVTTSEIKRADLTKRNQASLDISKNTIITTDNTSPIYDVKVGDKLKQIIGGKGFYIEQEITVLQNGFIGDTIRYKSNVEKTGKIINRNGLITINNGH